MCEAGALLLLLHSFIVTIYNICIRLLEFAKQQTESSQICQVCWHFPQLMAFPSVFLVRWHQFSHGKDKKKKKKNDTNLD